jgi:hypothetical protein
MNVSTSQGLARLLAGLDVRAASLPPSAVLLVRRLADPRPRSLDPSDPGVRPPPLWERALQDAIDHAAGQAARPAEGPVPPSAEAVVFLDPAELLACLARDCLLGTVSVNWWWQAWLRASGRSTLELVLDAWIREARHVPAAVVALHDRRLAPAFVRALSARQARALFVALAEAYEIPALAAPTPGAHVPIVPPRGVRTRSARRNRASRRGRAVEDLSTRRPDAVGPPWRPLVPPASVPETLDLEQRTLLGVALALARAPLAVRTHAFQRAFLVWRRAEQLRLQPAGSDTSPVRDSMIGTAPTAHPVENGSPGVEVLARGLEARPPIVETGASATPVATISQEHRTARPERAGAQGDLKEAPSDEDADVATPPASPAERPGPPIEAARPATRRTSAPGSAAAVVSAGQPVPSAATSGGAAIRPASSSLHVETTPGVTVEFVRTGLAGVLFLINALKRLELFDRLDDHFGVTSSIGGWAWLEIVARSLLGGRRKGAASDPIWDVLATLDGRQTGTAISGTFRGPRSYELPEDWPAPVRAYRPTGRRSQRRPLGFKPAQPLGRFLETLLPYLRWRLLNGMSLEARSARDEDALLVSRLLYRRGRLSYTRTHVDLHMGMDQVDIAVRLAGLDANPGWVPALGRVVTFYYD